MPALRCPKRKLVKGAKVRFNAMYTRIACPQGAEAGNGTPITCNLNTLRLVRPAESFKRRPKVSSASEALDHSREAQPSSVSKLDQNVPKNQLAETSMKDGGYGTGNHDTCPRPSAIPPKRTVLDTATAVAGAASTSHGQKRKTEIAVNTKLYKRLCCIGKGGSARVYRVTADGYRIMALKKVFLQNTEKSALEGLKGDIRLLEKLANVDRVVHLFDWEINSNNEHLNLVRLNHSTKSTRFM